MSPVEISEKLLSEAGGWQAMKHARALLEMGRVISSSYTPPILKGFVREGEKEYRAGLKIRSRTDVENLCSCRESRQWGTICAHSIAVGLHHIQPSSSRERADKKTGGDSPEKTSLARFSNPSGQTIELHVIIAPDFTSKWKNCYLTVGIEVLINGKFFLINTLDPESTFNCGDHDLALLRALAGFVNRGTLPGVNVLNREQFLELLAALKGHPRVTFGRRQKVVIESTALRPRLEVAGDNDGGITLTAEIPPKGILLCASSLVWWFDDFRFQEISPGLPLPYQSLLTGKPVKLDKASAVDFLLRELPELRRFFETASTPGAQAEKFEIKAGTPRISMEIEGSLNRLAARLQFLYAKRVITAGVTSRAENFIYNEPGDEKGQMLARNLEFEDASVERLTRNGFHGPDAAGFYLLKGEQNILPFFAKDLPLLQQQWIVRIGSRFSNVTKNIERLHVDIRADSSGENWFDLDVSLTGSSNVRFSAAEIQGLLRSGKSHVRLPNNRLAVFDPASIENVYEALRDCDLDQSRPGQYRMHRVNAGFLEAMAADDQAITLRGNEAWRNWTQNVGKGPDSMTQVPMGELENVLRPYQKSGVSWMSFLAGNGLGGILADEMGLGKTLQTLAFARWLQSRSGERNPILVICPSSLIYNWAREAELYTPDLKALSIHGANRKPLFAKISDYDLIITSYPLLRRDFRHYQHRDFALAVLDEAQHIKNPDTQNAQAAARIRARTRFVLTGTPVENSVSDLWSIMNFVLPGYLGSKQDFQDRYLIPITRGREPEAQKRLNQRLRPFILRRLKRDVATELPEKIEQIAYCELGEKQSAVYREILEQGRRKMDEAASEKNRGRARMMVLTTLLRLRQACCDLRLLGIDDSALQTSAKLELLDELLEEALDGGHRVLVFSQFVTMLGLIRERFESLDIRYAYLDGSTKDRQAAVHSFQSDSELPVFLISLKAGGVGLNLTGADTVVHFDPWWNPAVEAQATDRAHRIGQRNVVTSYKLIARGTVEEKILNLQKKKRDIINATVESEEPLMDALSMDEIASLLEE